MLFITGGDTMTTPTHFPGFESFKDLASFMCRCPNCGAEKEIFSDELEVQHNCTKCSEPIDFTRCEYCACGTDETPR